VKKYLYLFLLIIVLTACKNDTERKNLNARQPKVVEAKGYVVPNDSMATPKVFLVDESKLKKIKAGNPKVVPTNLNVHLAGNPKVVVAGKPRVITPGQDTFLLPKIVPAIDSPFVAGIPEVVVAKDPYIRDQNPQNFSSFSKLQGLKHHSVRCMLQDKFGNLWFGTVGGGVSKYDGKMFTHFTEKEGLSNNNVWSILEDRFGNLWFGTWGGGVSKYDGKEFTHFTEKEGLSNNLVMCILEDKSGNIWFGTTGGGVSKYDGKVFTHFTEKEGLSNNNVWSILEDRFGNLWFGTEGGGVSKYDGKGFTHFTEKEGLSNNVVVSSLEDKSGNLWFGTSGGGASKYDGIRFTHFTEKEGLSNNLVVSILEDKSGNIWLGTHEGGVSKYDGKEFTHFTEKEGLSKNYVFSILEDRSGNLWFGTAGGGVSKYSGNSFTHFTEKEGLNSNHGLVLSILEDKSGNLWFGTAGGGVSKYDGKEFTHFTEKEGLSNNFVMSILEDRSGNLWFGTEGGGVSKYDGKSFTLFTEKDGLSNNVVWRIIADRSGNLWFCTDEGGVSKYDGKSFTHFTEKEGLSNNTVRSITEDKSGNLWFGTGRGASKYDGKRFTHFTAKEGLSNNLVLSILEDKSGNLWFGTMGGGVCKYDGKSFTHFTEKEGLSNNVVSSIIEDRSDPKGGIWLGTRFGFNKLTIDKLAALRQAQGTNLNLKDYDVLFKNYGYDDGFLGVGCNLNSILQAKDGSIWVGANDRLTVCHPEGFAADTLAPSMQVTGIELFNEPITWPLLLSKQDSTLVLRNGMQVSGYSFSDVSRWYNLPENLSLAYNNNYLTFNFIGITMSQPKRVKYKYKLEGMDENWSGLTSRNEATYGNLPHGTYTFMVKSMNSEGYWSKPFEYTFTIRPPWWLTWWFKTFAGVFIIGSVIFFIKWRERKLKAEKIILEKTVEERTAEVVQQKHLIEEKHKEITDSINYAERIQRSFLATKDLLDENLKDYFVFFQPKDVVSGDFYWASKLNNGSFAYICADSTGHGVSGAILTVLAISYLNYILLNKEINHAGQVLDYLDEKWIETFQQGAKKLHNNDWVEISICVYNTETSEIEFAGANSKALIIKQTGEQIECVGNKYPIGGWQLEQNRKYTTQTFEVLSGDMIYLFSDGFKDQFSGNTGKRLTKKNFYNLLSNTFNLPCELQKNYLNKELYNWMGGEIQTDDVCVVGVRF